MRDFADLTYNETTEKLVDVLTRKTQNTDSRLYFRLLVSFYMCQMASSMRTVIRTMDRGDIPINMYALILGTSGMGKGLSTNIIEKSVVNQFKDTFTGVTFPAIAAQNISLRASKKASLSGREVEEEEASLLKEFNSAGAMLYSFDSGTAPAFKQVRHKALLADIGSLNFICDEIGTNLLGNAELLAVYLEAYDVGLIKQKLIKNTAENQRAEEIDGAVPTNMLLFGTPSKLLNGGKEEQELWSLFDTGYGRRCFFGLGIKAAQAMMSAEDMFDLMTDPQNESILEELSNEFAQLAEPANYKRIIYMEKPVTLLMYRYKIHCEKLAESLPEHKEIRKAEISHRYFKAIKLAGAHAFLDGSPTMEESHLYEAIKLTEESGQAFEKILTRDKNYVRLAKYLADVSQEVTHADLVEDLPFYRGTNSVRQEMLQLATAWGYRNNIIIKKHFIDGIEFLRGESLKETSLDSVVVSYSDHEAYNYRNETPKFEDLHKLTQVNGLHWCNHTFLDNHRTEDNALIGFNMLVLDVDGGTQMAVAQTLLKDITAFYYTTKRHTDADNRFRIVIPLKYHLRLSAKDFKEFYANIIGWLPFDVDANVGQRSKKWLSHNGTYTYNMEGEILDPIPFIPKTSKNEERVKSATALKSMDSLQRWFIQNTGEGNRNVQLSKYALLLLDNGQTFVQIQENVLALNEQLQDKLTESEINKTIMASVANKMSKR